MQVVLIMLSNGGERRSFSVVRSTTTIGRREDCDLRIPVGDVSRKHCRLVLAPDTLRVQDLGSSNGTFVNGQQVQDAFLNAGDTVSVGPVNFVVQIDGVPGDEHFDAATPAGDTGAGGTALALEALTSGEAAKPGPESAELTELLVPAAEVPAGDAVVDDFVITEEPVDDVLLNDDITLDAVPPDAPGAAAAFETVELDDVAAPDAVDAPVAAPEAPDAPATPVAPAVEEDWDFLLAEPDAKGGVDLHVDLDPPHDHQPPA